MPVRRHKPILDEYKAQLQARRRRREIGADTEQIHYETAQRLLEACLRSISRPAMRGIVATWFSPEAYEKVADDLYALIEERPRSPRSVDS